jgi:WD40 repeat protein
MLDLDGSETLSQVRSVRFSPSARVSPNPATGPFAVTGVSADHLVQLFDAMGREVPISMIRGDHDRATVDPLGAPPGVYQLRIAGDHATAIRVAIER